MNSLFLHEETIPEVLEKLAAEIRMDEALKHPVIVDEKSLVVLDGMHRVAALKMLNCRRVPVCLVDYKNPSIIVGAWYRTIASINKHSANEILEEIRNLGFNVKKGDVKSVEEIGKNSIIAALKMRENSYLVCHVFENLKEAYDHIKMIEDGLKQFNLQVNYETEADSFRKLREGKVDAILQTPRLSKEEIVKIALSGKVFVHKATRHVIPARPLNVNVPLRLLTLPSLSLEEVNEEFRRMLMEKKLKMMPAGSYIENRRYEEDVYLFED
ncbi:MAG TPA: ABC transporter ATP-binding protein [Candidatus Bathyarchaeota archaeon]|nr:ABC transporter ATP-binding protein [Candidatus Bathyarchaeota archaeon]HEX68909.1 ABC transporter ATP-binding protein [Candidatus Bathyarchaeota archaeon]